jgi:uracil-DNA glycosylase family 4
MSARELRTLAEEIETCRRCPRLVTWREKVARTKRRAYADEAYWGRPVAGFGDPRARIVLVGLAPGAHGANRTGRAFTGDRSGDFLFAALHRAGLANQAESRARGDGLTLRDVFITLPVRCAPPDNAPTPSEIARCTPFFVRELSMLPSARVYVALGAIAFRSMLALAPRDAEKAPHFAHGAWTEIAHPASSKERAALVASYHVSQQNTQTGRLTPAMFDALLGAVIERATSDA